MHQKSLPTNTNALVKAVEDVLIVLVKKRNIYCTELCGCFGDTDNCDNTAQDEVEYDDEE